MAPRTQILKYWNNFLCVDKNKTELFKFLSHQAINLPIDQRKVIYGTDGGNVLTTEANALLTNLSSCLHEEAHNRLLLHAAYAVKKGHRKLCVRTVDTDVVVNAIVMFNQINPDELRFAFGTGSNFRYIPIHEVVSGMDPRIVLFYQFLTNLQDAIPPGFLVEEEKRQLRKSGQFFLMSLKYSNTSF